jgi:hypothetical protein
VSILNIDPELRAEMIDVACELDRAHREVLVALLRRAFLAVVATYRGEPKRVNADDEEAYWQPSGRDAVMDRLMTIENGAIAAQLEDLKYTRSGAVAGLGVPAAGLPPERHRRLRRNPLEKDPMFELEMLEGWGHL